jgi:hypothetical protein
MVLSSDVARFRADGHTVAETMTHFSISERTVYNASARARRESVATPVELPPASPAPTPADDLAGDNTYWKCPVCGDLIPVVPGARRHAWMAERRRLFVRSFELDTPAPAAPVELDTPAPAAPVELDTPAPAAPVELDTPAPASVSVALPRSAPARQYNSAVHALPALHNFDLYTHALLWFSEFWRVPLALVVALLLIILSR